MFNWQAITNLTDKDKNKLSKPNNHKVAGCRPQVSGLQLVTCNLQQVQTSI
jgi:hypothetical protein